MVTYTILTRSSKLRLRIICYIVLKSEGENAESVSISIHKVLKQPIESHLLFVTVRGLIANRLRELTMTLLNHSISYVYKSPPARMRMRAKDEMQKMPCRRRWKDSASSAKARHIHTQSYNITQSDSWVRERRRLCVDGTKSYQRRALMSGSMAL